MTRVAQDFNLAKFDIGGQGATAGDGKLTGKEVERAKQAGYSVWEGYSEKDGKPTETNGKGYAFGYFTRDAALTDSKICQVGSKVLDCILSPITLPISMIQAFLSSDDK